MPLPVIAITNASTCLTDAQVEAVLPALQKQASDDFKAYWELDCTLTFLNNGQPLTRGWWQIVITDNPDQAGALGYHEMTNAGTPLVKSLCQTRHRKRLIVDCNPEPRTARNAC